MTLEALEVQLLLEEKNIAFRSGNKAHHSTARDNLKRSISKAKSDNRRKIEDHLISKDRWAGVARCATPH